MEIDKANSNAEEHKLNVAQPEQQHKLPRRRLGLSDFERIRVLGKGAFGKSFACTQ